MHMSIVFKIYLYPSDRGLIGPIMSTQITENGVFTSGNFPNGPLLLFLWTHSSGISHMMSHNHAPHTSLAAPLCPANSVSCASASLVGPLVPLTV